MQYREIDQTTKKKVDDMLLMIEGLFIQQNRSAIQKIVKLESFKELCLQDDLFLQDGVLVRDYVLQHLKRFNAVPIEYQTKEQPKVMRRMVFDSASPQASAAMAKTNNKKIVSFDSEKGKRQQQMLWGFSHNKPPKSGVGNNNSLKNSAQIVNLSSPKKKKVFHG